MNKLFLILSLLLSFSALADIWYDIDHRSAEILADDLKPGKLLLNYCESCQQKYEIRIIKNLEIIESKTSFIVDVKPAYNLMLNSVLITAGKTDKGKIPTEFFCGANQEFLKDSDFTNKEEYYCANKKEVIGYNYSYLIKPHKYTWLPAKVKNSQTALNDYLTKYKAWSGMPKNLQPLNKKHYQQINKCLKELFEISCR